MDRSSRQKVSNDIVELNNTNNQMDVIDICRLHHPKTAEYTFSTSSHVTFPKTDQILGQKVYLNKFKRNHIMPALRPKWNQTRNQ